MKKIIIVIAAVLMGINANAQLSEDFKTFTLGNYVFDALSSLNNLRHSGGDYWCGGGMDVAEVFNLYCFIKEHRQDIEKKFNVTIIKIDYSTHILRIDVYNTDAYNKYIREQEAKAAAKEREKKSRLESLEKIF